LQTFVSLQRHPSKQRQDLLVVDRVRGGGREGGGEGGRDGGEAEEGGRGGRGTAQELVLLLLLLLLLVIVLVLKLLLLLLLLFSSLVSLYAAVEDRGEASALTGAARSISSRKSARHGLGEGGREGERGVALVIGRGGGEEGRDKTARVHFGLQFLPPSLLSSFLGRQG